MKSTLFAVLFSFTLINTVFAGPLEDGIAAYGARDYERAHQHWQSLAQDRTVTGLWAKYYLGLLHELGLGMPIDRVKARAYYAPAYEKLARHIFQDEVTQKANELLPIDAVYRLAMIDVGRALDMDSSDDQKERRMAPSVMQGARMALDIAGFYRHPESFYQVGLLELHGTGKRFLRNEESAWAHFVLAGELGNRKAEQAAAGLSLEFNRTQLKKAERILQDYRKYMRPPY